MICQRCKEEASIHLTELIDGRRHEFHLCAPCARKAGLALPEAPPSLPLDAVVQSLIVANVGELVGELAEMSCPDCGIKFMEFRSQGRLGCPYDYTVFRLGLHVLLQRIHRATQHVGKSPRQQGPHLNHLVEIAQLRRQLQSAVDAEAYEEAARLRDLLRRKEATDESG